MNYYVVPTYCDNCRQMERDLAAARMDIARLRSVLIEIRVRLHSAGHRPEEGYEMSVIDAAIADAEKGGGDE